MDIPSLSTIQSSTSVNAWLNGHTIPALLPSTSCELSCESTNYINESHTVKAFEVLQSLREDENGCDIKLKADDDTFIFCHKIILMSASQYFRAMFTNFSECEKDIIDIRRMESTVLKNLVDYFYTGKIMISKENVQDLLPAANLLQLDCVKGACTKFLIKQLDPFNCINMRSFADLHNCLDLFSTCDLYIRKKFRDVVEGEEFLSLSTEELIKLISSNVLNASEEEVYECILNWVKHRLNDRSDSLPKLMEHVRLPLASLEYISSNVIKEPLFKNLPKSEDYLIEAFKFHKLKEQQLTIPETIRNTPRMSGQKGILVFCSFYGNYWYDPTTNEWERLKKKCQTFFYEINKSALIKDHFVVEYSSTHLQKLDLSLKSPSWETLPGMLVSRTNFGFGVLDDCLYAVGGCGCRIDGNDHLNSAEKFDMNNQEWRMIANMSTKRSNIGVGVLNGLLYAVGGINNDSMQLKSVEYYNESVDTWTTVAEMRASRSDVGVGVMDGVLYAVGGKYGDICLSSVEAYKPSTGWTSIPNMHIARSGSSVFALDGLLYVIGGYDGGYSGVSEYDGADFVTNYKVDPHPLNCGEIYDPNTNTWSMNNKINFMPNDIASGVIIVDKALVTKFRKEYSVITQNRCRFEINGRVFHF